MANFTTNIIYDNFQRSVVQFTHFATGGLPAYGLTATIAASSLTGYNSTLSVTSSDININVTKVYWSLPQGSTATGVELAWGVSGSITGTPFMYLNNTGYWNFAADGIPQRNNSTANTRINTFQIRNTNAINTNDSMTITVELDKNGGYVRQM